MSYGPGGFNHGGGYTQRLAWGGPGRREGMPITRAVAILSSVKNQAEAEYVAALTELETKVEIVKNGYLEQNDIDPRAAQTLAKDVLVLVAKAEKAYELRQLVERLSE